MKKRVIFFYFLLLIFIALFVYSSIKIYTWNVDNKRNKEILDNLVKYKKEVPNQSKFDVDFESLKNVNPDTVCYIKVKGTNIDYPVVKTDNNDYYLNHNFNKEKNVAGWLFVNYVNTLDGNDKNITIFGHNMRDGGMFGSLKNVLTDEWNQNKENFKIDFFTKDKHELYEVFSTYKIEKEDYYLKNSFKSDVEYENFLNKLAKRSKYDYNTSVDVNDSILTLSTCDTNNKYRVVLHARKVSN